MKTHGKLLVLDIYGNASEFNDAEIEVEGAWVSVRPNGSTNWTVLSSSMTRQVTITPFPQEAAPLLH